MSLTPIASPTSPPRPTPPPLPTALPLVPWPDPVLDTVGHDPRSAYVERFWLSTLGPTTLWMLRRFADGFEDAPEGFTIDLGEVSSALGLGGKHHRDSPFMRALLRTGSFGLTRPEPDGGLAVRRRLPAVSRRQLDRLPPSLRAEHASWVSRKVRRPDAGELRARARQLAASLRELGESYEQAERQLHRWRFHPALAHDAVRWAWSNSGPDDRTPGTALSAPSGSGAPPPG